MALDISRLMEAEKEAKRLVDEATAEARWIRHGSERECAEVQEVAERECANLQRRLESDFDRELSKLGEESRSRIEEVTAAARASLSAKKQAAVERVKMELLRQ